jgi:hypothetical protein
MSLELLKVVAALQDDLTKFRASMPLRSVEPPENPPIGKYWTELRPDGAKRYRWAWYWTGIEWRSTWQLIRCVGSGLVAPKSSASFRLDLGYPPLEWVESWRIRSLTVTGVPSGPDVVLASSVRQNGRPWGAVTAIDGTGGAKPYPVAIEPDARLPLDVRSIDWDINNSGSAGWQGDLVIVLEAIRMPGALAR